MSGSDSVNERSSSSDSAESRPADIELDIEEAWLLWKLDRKNEASEIILPLLEQVSDDPGLLEIGVSIYIETGDMLRARESFDRLKALKGNSKRFLEIEAFLLGEEKKWDEALVLYNQLIEGDPQNWDLREARAQLFLEIKTLKRNPLIIQELLKTRALSDDK